MFMIILRCVLTVIGIVLGMAAGKLVMGLKDKFSSRFARKWVTKNE